MSQSKIVQFKDWQCRVQMRKYHNGQAAIQLVDANDGDAICTASVCLPDHAQLPGWVFIKDWSENQGVLDALIAANVIEDTGQRLPSGFVLVAVCKLIP